MSMTPVERPASEVAEFRPRYDLNDYELAALDHQMVAVVKETYPEPGVYSAVIDPDHSFSNFVRGHEAKFFPEATEFPAALEENTLSFALIDTRPQSDRVVHVGSVSGPGLVKDPEGFRGDHRLTTGFMFIDDLVDLGNFTADEFNKYYTERGTDLRKCTAVETNVRVGRPVERYKGVRTVDLGYITLMGLVDVNLPPGEDGTVFASVNLPQLLSFNRVGIQYEPLMGRTDLVTPESQLGRTSTPIAIPYTNAVRVMMKSVGPKLPQIHFEGRAA